MLKKYRKYAFFAYFLLCVIYCVVKIAIPVETTRGEGLENLGRRQIVERTAYLNEGDKISFTLPVESEPLTSIGFYLNTDQLALDGNLKLRVMDEATKEVLAELDIKENTLKFHNKNIYGKLGVSSRKQLVSLAEDPFVQELIDRNDI